MNVVRQTDISQGHGCFPPRPCVTGSPNVFYNGLPSQRVTDYYPTHCCGNTCHDGSLLSGSSTVFVNGLAQGRLGDPVSCGDTAGGNCSPNIFSG